MLKGADGGFALHGWKILKKLVQSLPPFEVIQQGLEICQLLTNQRAQSIDE